MPAVTLMVTFMFLFSYADNECRRENEGRRKRKGDHFMWFKRAKVSPL